MNQDDIKLLRWILERLVNMYDEKPNYDYMQAFKEIIDRFEERILADDNEGDRSQ